MLAYIDYPSWVTPEIFGFLHLPEGNFLNNFRWYGMMYIVAVGISYLLCMQSLKTLNVKNINKKNVDDYYFWGVIGLLLGARVIFCIVYDFPYYITHLWEILLPIRNGKFVGYAGMSFHGGAIGIFVVSVIFCKKRQISFPDMCDLIFPTLSGGYFFGRLANFINAELYGRITAAPIGMYFPNAQKLPLDYPHVQDVIGKLGWHIDQAAQTVTNAAGQVVENAIAGNMVNLPRHPSQLYEAVFEGIVLFLIMWFVVRKIKWFKGFSGSAYLAGYGIFRFVIEFFRQPDSQFVNVAKGNYQGYIFGHISMGQIFCLLMVLCAVIMGVWFYAMDRKIWFFANAGDTQNGDAGTKSAANNVNNKNKKKKK